MSVRWSSWHWLVVVSLLPSIHHTIVVTIVIVIVVVHHLWLVVVVLVVVAIVVSFMWWWLWFVSTPSILRPISPWLLMGIGWLVVVSHYSW